MNTSFDRENLKKLMEEFKLLVQNNELDFDFVEIFVTNENIIKNEEFYIAHSEIYRKMEKPAYRVVLKDIFKKHFLL